MKLFELFGSSKPTTKDIEKAAELLLQNCQPYLKEIDYNIGGNRIFRGMHVDHKSFIKEYKVNKARPPKDTPMNIHKTADEWFNKKFHIKFRSQGLFGFGAVVSANNYGRVYTIFPIGEFDYCYSNAYDDLTEIISAKAPAKATAEDIEEILEDGYYKFNVDLVKVINKKEWNEIMISCDSYYAIPFESYRDEYVDLVKTFKEIRSK